jgi:hypothetical protein
MLLLGSFGFQSLMQCVACAGFSSKHWGLSFLASIRSELRPSVSTKIIHLYRPLFY